jgi:hypothetical protein
MVPDETVLFRVGSLEGRVSTTETRVERLGQEKASRRDLDTLAAEVRSMRNALLVFALTVAVSAIGIAFAVLQQAGR